MPTIKTPTPAEAAAFIRVILEHHEPRLETDSARGARAFLADAAESLEKAAAEEAGKADLR